VQDGDTSAADAVLPRPRDPSRLRALLRRRLARRPTVRRRRAARLLRPDGALAPVVRADGSLAKGERQRTLLEAEGVPFRGDRVDVRLARIPE
jgi:hypothetical protein